MLKLKIVFYLFCLILFGFGFTAASAMAQTIAYRQTNLASSVPNAANNLTPALLNPWGIGFLSGQPFFLADNNGGHVTSLDASGLGVLPGGFILPNSSGTGFDSPTGIVADQNSSFGSLSLIKRQSRTSTMGSSRHFCRDSLPSHFRAHSRIQPCLRVTRHLGFR